MYIGSWKIGDIITVPANTHDPSTGAAADASSITYRVYEDNNGTPLLTGSLSKLDDAHTTGFYTIQLDLSSANGFEYGKSYTIYIEATVSGVTGTLSHTFQIRAQVAVQPGPGLNPYTYTLTDKSTSLPIAAAQVWVSTDVAGSNIICSGYTDAFGQVVFYLDPGTYQFWAWKTGYSRMGPDAEVVT